MIKYYTYKEMLDFIVGEYAYDSQYPFAALELIAFIHDVDRDVVLNDFKNAVEN